MSRRSQPGWRFRLPALLSCGAMALGLLGGSLRAQEWLPERQPAAPVRVIWFPNPPYAMDAKGVPSGLEITSPTQRLNVASMPAKPGSAAMAWATSW